MSPSRFEGRPVVETTEYERDDNGQIIQAVTTRDSDWTDQDRTEVLALLEYEQSLCPCGCGHLYEDTTSHYSTGPEFIVTKTTCRARAALVEEQRAAEERGGAPDGRLWGTVMQRG